MGDSSIVPVNAYKTTWRYTCGHCEEQKDYLDHKRDILKPFTWELRPQIRHLNGKTFHGFKLETFSHLVFGHYRCLFYPEGVKRFTSDIFDRITPRSLAFWLMDDGSNNGALGYHNNLEEFEALRSFLNQRFNLRLKIRHIDENFFGLFASGKDQKYKLATLVYPYVIPSMRYKIQSWLDNFEPSLVGNNLEGAETRGSLNPIGHGDNTHPSGVILSGSAGHPNG
jgi:hypothetical protein